MPGRPRCTSVAYNPKPLALPTTLMQVVPEPVDTAFFDPTKHKPLPLPLGLRVFGPAWPHSQAAESRTAAGSVAAAVAGQQAGGSRAAQADGGKGGGQAEPFVFLAVFKWEARKASIGAIVVSLCITLCSAVL